MMTTELLFNIQLKSVVIYSIIYRKSTCCQHLIPRNRRLELFQVERFEIGGIFKLASGKGLFRERNHVYGKRIDIFDKDGVRRSDDRFAFGGTVAKETNFPFFQVRSIRAGFHNISLRLADRL